MSEHPEGYPLERRIDASGLNLDVYRRPGGFLGDKFCGAPHPDNPDPETEPENFDFYFCRRLPHHDGSDHAAFVRSISTPDTWPDERGFPL